MLIYIIGGKLVYPGRFEIGEIALLLNVVVKARVLSFIASAPLLLVAVIQRRTFYPTIMLSLAFTGIELFALMLPAKFASLIPWSAAMLFGYGMTGEYTINAIVVIICSGIIGILGGCHVFLRQNQ